MPGYDEIGKNLEKDLITLTETIGIRLSGTEEEKKAAEYLAERFREYTQDVVIETFPTSLRDITFEEIEADGVKYPCNYFCRAPRVPGGSMTAEMAFFAPVTDFQRDDLSYLKGKAVLCFGGLPAGPEDYRRLMEAEPAFILVADLRVMGPHPVAGSLLPGFADKIGAVPTAAIAYDDAWTLMAKKTKEVTLRVEGENRDGISRNVIATFPGTDPDAEILYCGGHIDSVAGSVGADDNAVGCIILEALAQIFAGTEHKHTIRLIAFGTEEQLSVGSASYIRAHRAEAEAKGAFIFNFDSCGSIAGWNACVINMLPENEAWVRERLKKEDIYFEEYVGGDPYTDQFAFNAVGVPGISILRRNCTAGMFYHHTPWNTKDVVSIEIVEKIAKGFSKLIGEAADMDSPKSVFGNNPEKDELVAMMWEKLYGGF